MPDQYLSRQYPASFRGVQFWIRSETKDSDGLRYIIHEYPNSAIRYAEYQGEIPPSFTVSAFVHGPDRLERAASLRRALKTPGPGPLVLSTYGSFNAVAMEFAERVDQTDIGEIQFTIPFVTSVGAVAPAEAPKSIEDVFDLGDNARSAMETEFANMWLDPNTPPNVIVAQFDTLTMLDAIADVITETTSDVTNAVDYIYNGVGSLTNDPVSFAAALFGVDTGSGSGLFTAISTSLARTKSSLAKILELRNFGSRLTLSLSEIRRSKPENDVRFGGTEIPLWPETTLERIARNINRKTLVQATRISALVCAYEQGAAIETYTTKGDVAQATNDIETAYRVLYQDQAEDTTSIANRPSVHAAVEALRAAALEVLGGKRQQAYGLVALPVVPGESALELAYRLYAEAITDDTTLTAKTSEIRRLNPTESAIDLVGQVDVLQV